MNGKGFLVTAAWVWMPVTSEVGGTDVKQIDPPIARP